MSPLKPAHWKAPAPSFGEMLASALARSFAWAISLSVLIFSSNAVWHLYKQIGLPSSLFASAGVIFLVVWTGFFGFFLIGASRVWSDRAFTISGFSATFLGLAILAVFFVRLADEVAAWYYYTPILVEQQNEVHRATIAYYERVKSANEDELLKLLPADSDLIKVLRNREKDIAAAPTEEKKQQVRELYAFGIPNSKEKVLQGLQEKAIIAERSLRTDLSAFGLLVTFMQSGASDKVQDAGIAPALIGSLWLGLITILFAVPIGVGAALYLEEYRQEGWLARVIQININNLAGVPSVVYGILGGFAFVYIFRELSEVYPLVASRNLLGGGLTLALLTMPVIIVSTQEAIRAVPGSLRQGAYALGATKWQVIWTIVLPMARPGILTGTILSLSRAIGEAAPLVFMGAKMFINQLPMPWTPFTALPLQIFNWCDRLPVAIEAADRSVEYVDVFKYNAAVASCVLLVLLLSMNAIAIFLRNRAQRKMRY
jgi:phosphate transport system permease protein